ncbi:transporter substrate-binding domain-containing protein [Chitinimonas sp. BJB300]|uniref:transporter substrate-binding domain-containing protein n=1 Tax=Chitinimonas sp. BJB300 TaxID=1559339 RepID=UPI000C0F9B7C|nr:transporter substrate-binding domain-containing protein [Chitinimonas sp. BJB300]PHV10175.1 cystine ABC transporter substrate-binding protein [Chitinimonas sp. BJB300]TSJ91301.1 transporter substrate-binding domain-containing protein [Chitinimonas sp. BJB300]
MHKRIFLKVLLAIGLFTTASAADLLDTVKARGTLKIALEGTYPPFSFKNTKGELDGFDVETAKLLAKKLNLKPEFVTIEWGGILAGLQTGKYDIIVNQVAATDKRKEVFDFTQPYTLSSAQLILRKDVSHNYKGLADLKGKKLGVGQGSNYADLAKAVDGVEVKTYPGAPEYLQDLALGRLDAALNDSLLIPYLIKQAKLPLKGGAVVGSVEGSAIPYLKGNPAFGAALDKALAEAKADGSFARISKKYFDRDVSKPLQGV